MGRLHQVYLLQLPMDPTIIVKINLNKQLPCLYFVEEITANAKSEIASERHLQLHWLLGQYQTEDH